MTTIIVTKTHIAHDRCVMEAKEPVKCWVDEGYQKVFFDPKQRFCFGVAGAYNPSQVDTPEIYEAMEILTEFLINKFSKEGPHSYFTRVNPKNPMVLPAINEAFKLTATILVTKDYRFKFVRSKEEGLVAILIGDVYAEGTGSDFAVGMVLAGMKLEDIWEKVHGFDQATSVAHAVHDLSVLKDWEEVQ